MRRAPGRKPGALSVAQESRGRLPALFALLALVVRERIDLVDRDGRRHVPLVGNPAPPAEDGVVVDDRRRLVALDEDAGAPYTGDDHVGWGPGRHYFRLGRN